MHENQHNLHLQSSGTNIVISNRGRKEITFANGQKEIHTVDFKVNVI